jgi:protein required for attachment to host cells
MRKTCVLVADAARARLFRHGMPDAENDVLEEVRELVEPERRQTDSEVFSESRPGLYQAMRGGPRHGFDDHRDEHRAEEDRRFAAEVLDQAAEVCKGLGRCRLVLAASPNMLGMLRSELARRGEWVRHLDELCELDRDLSRLPPAELHDWLAARELLAPRERRTL